MVSAQYLRGPAGGGGENLYPSLITRADIELTIAPFYAVLSVGLIGELADIAGVGTRVGIRSHLPAVCKQDQRRPRLIQATLLVWKMVLGLLGLCLPGFVLHEVSQ